MAPPTPGRHRGPRPQVNNNIGEAGRTTNIAPPKGIPRDSAGHEQVEAFFDSRKYERDHGSASDDDQQDAEDYYAADTADQTNQHRSAPRRKSEHVNRRTQYSDRGDDDDDDEDFGDQVRRSNQARKPQQQASARKRQPVAQTGRTPTGARERGAERPDRYMVGDDRGRKTGITKAVVQRDEDGMEDLDAYFASPEGGRSIATTTAGARSTIKKASRNNYAAFDRDDEQNASYYEQEDDEQDDDGISPLTYQRQHPSTGRAPSALQHSTTAAGERSVSRKGLSSPQANGVGSSASKSRGNRRRLSSVENDAEQQEYDDEEQYDQQQAYNDDDEEDEEDEDDEEEEEEVRAALGAKPASTDASPAKKPRKSVASNRRDAEDDYQRDASLEMEDSPSGLTKLDRNGRPVPADRPKNKGKGRASDYAGSPARRETFAREEVEEQYVEQDQYYPDEFGGEGYGEDPYDQHAYGDGGAGEDDYDSADGRAGHDDVDVREVDNAGNVVSDGDDDNDQQMQGPSSKPYKGKGKGKARERPSSNQRSSDSQSVSPQRRATSSKQARRRPQNQSQQPVVTEVSRKRTREAGTVDIDGVRRSSREKVPRLEYWRNERIIYERRRSGVGLKAIVRVPKEDPGPLTKAGHRKGHHGVKRSTSARAPSRGKSVKAEVPEEQGCDDMTDPDGLVWSWEGEAETTRRIAFTEKMMDPKLTMDGKFAYQKIYQELDYLASGVLTIPPGGEKGLKSSKDNSYVFCVLQGSVSVTVHRTRFSIGPGGTFFIPRGNMYCIVATSNREVRLFFAQGRRVIEYADGETRPDTREDSMRFIENEELQAVPEEDEEDEDGR